MDASLVSAGYGAIGSFFSISASNAVSSIQADASNRITGINNETANVLTQRNAALTGLQRWAQQVRNDRVMENLALNQQALATNFNRSRDARTRQNFAANIRDAEQQGRQRAAAAASGVTGSVVDVVNQATAVKRGIEETARIATERQISYDYKLTEQQQYWSALDQLDTGLIFDNPEMLDYRTATAKTSNATTAALTSFITQGGLGGLDSFFQPPKSHGDDLGAFLTLNDNFSYK